MAKKKKTTISPAHTPNRPPIVAILGHVDHGKTTLLDTIRKTSLAEREHGGITQHIGAYSIEAETKDGKKSITFIDTPGHEAFAKMRSRGASVADIAVLVVSAVDGVMPQTVEAIGHIQAASIPFLVAANKMDLPEAQPDKIKQQLAKVGVLVEGYGGDTVMMPISAKTGQGILEFLDMIILLWEMHGKDDGQGAPRAVVIESRTDRRKGPVASLIVKSGHFVVGDPLSAEGVGGKVRAMNDWTGAPQKIANPSDAVEVLGFSSPPPVGAVVLKGLAGDQESYTKSRSPLTATDVNTAIKLIVKADTAGTFDAIQSVLPQDIQIVFSGIGDVNESDVLLAKASGALIMGFQVNVLPAAAKLALFERVMIKTYTIIYELAKEIGEVVAAIKEGRLEERLGEAEVLAEFPFDGDRIVGVRVTEGRMAKGDQIRIMRGEEEVGRGRVKSVRQRKDEVNKVEVGGECGLHLTPQLDFRVGDMIISYR